MGAVIKKKKKYPNDKNEKNLAKSDLEKPKESYPEDVNEIVNLAFAIQKNEFVENIELFISCEKLPKLDFLSLSDPMVIFFVWKNNEWVKIGSTEVIPECLNPKFLKSFVVKYTQDIPKKLKFEVYDIDEFENLDDLSKQDLIGYMECDILEIIMDPNHTISKSLINPNSNRKKNGTLYVRGMEYDVTNTKYEFSFSGYEFVIKGEVYLKFSLLSESKEFIPFYVTNPEKNSKKGIIWASFSVPSTKFYEETITIKIEAIEFNKNKGSIPIAEVEQTLQNLLENSNSKLKSDSFDKFVNETNRNKLEFKKNGLSVGQIYFKVRKIEKNTFLNYIFGGAEVSLIIGIDFSKSNKDPNDPSSLHYLNDEGDENEYIQAISSIVGFLQYYDHDNSIPVYGFSAKLPPYYDIVSQCFACNGDFYNPEITGIDEIIKCYKNTVKSVKFHGPSAINEIISLGIEYAKDQKLDSNNQKYYILLIFTDGNLNFIQEAKKEIIEASDYPISISIIGVGNTDSQKLKDLDNFQMLLKSDNKININRDIVQYVNYRKYKHDSELLAKETLAELPNQFLNMMEAKNIPPMKKTKHLTAASHEFMQHKIEEIKQNKNAIEKPQSQVRKFLLTKKEELISQLKLHNYDINLIEEINNQKIMIPAHDINLSGQIISHTKNLNQGFDDTENQNLHIHRPLSVPITDKMRSAIVNDPNLKHRFLKVKEKVSYKNTNKVRKQNELYENTKKHLEKIEFRDFLGVKKELPAYFSRSIKQQKQENDKGEGNEFSSEKFYKNYYGNPDYQRKILKNTMIENKNLKFYSNKQDLCLICFSEKIQLVFMPCGHAAICLNCYEERESQLNCIICKEGIEFVSVLENNEEKNENTYSISGFDNKEYSENNIKFIVENKNKVDNTEENNIQEEKMKIEEDNVIENEEIKDDDDNFTQNDDLEFDL